MEELTGDNRYMCEACARLVDARKANAAEYAKQTTLPNI